MTRVLWHTPNKPTDISVGRRRIADHLEEAGLDVTLRGTTRETLVRSIRERSQYDVVVGTTRSGALAAVTLRLLGGPPLVVDHIDPISQFAENNSASLTWGVRAAENLAFRLSAATLFVYEPERTRVERHASRAVKTSLGVEYERFAQPDSAVVDRARTQLETVAETNVAIYVGGLEPIYNVESLLDAFDLLDEWALVVVGTGSLRRSVERRAAERDNVHYLGTVPHEEVPGYLAVGDVGVSLVDDPHTLKVLEYGAAGLPTVQLDGAARERFGDRIEYCDDRPSSVASAIQRAGQRDTEPLRTLASEYDWAEIAAEYATVITSVK